jgi:hypothetical protein
MGTAEESRQAKALEGILGQLTFVNQLLRKLVEIKDLPTGIDTNKLRPLVTASGRLVGWMIPEEMSFSTWKAQETRTMAFDIGVQTHVDQLKKMIGGTITTVSVAPDNSIQIQCEFRTED